VKEEHDIPLKQKVVQLQKECSYLERKLARLKDQQIRQEKIDDINRHLLKQTNERLLQYHNQAQRENISKSDFLANMSHEIRTPLNIILGMANLLADTELNKTQTQYLNSLRVTGRQLMEILNNILEFSRIDAGKITIESEPFSLEKILNQIEAAILPLCIQKNLKYSVEYDPLLVMERIGDPLKIFQILLNLTNNAVKFTPSGSVILGIKENYQKPGHLVLSVIDTGIGISEEQQKIIFDRFTQVHDSLAQQHSGAGLGLAISQKLTKVMGGELKVRSALGRGSVFSCSLPLPPAAPSDRRRVRIDASVIMPDSFPKLKILAVDDIKDNLEVIRVYLQNYPVQMATAENGEEALSLLASDDFDLILMDVRMPVMDGITATKEIRARETRGTLRPQTILAITAHAFQEQKNKFLQAGFDGVLSKPFFKRELIQTIYKYTIEGRTVPRPTELGNKALGFCLEQEKPGEVPDSLKELLPDVLKTITDDLNTMKLALQQNNHEHLYDKAHALRGVAGMFGFQKLASLIIDLSQTVKSGNLVVAEEIFDTLDVYLSQLQKP
jgi:signal transduction histidine kinase/CheY-like chemotaxis protein/HPt (histidine-containing phosphotransfer) domain-containing protein